MADVPEAQRLRASQQPFAQLAVVHWQCPPWQVWPGAQAAKPPQVHAPRALHPSARLASQDTQTPPPAPHAVTEVVAAQLPSLQQVVQLPALQLEHTPASQTPVAPQSAHKPPPAPHAPRVSPPWQAPPSSGQQPLRHELASQTQWATPPWATHRVPAPQGGPFPHAQDPLPQTSAAFASQDTHAEPPLPHEAREGAWHVPSIAQQPEHVPQVGPASLPASAALASGDPASTDPASLLIGPASPPASSGEVLARPHVQAAGAKATQDTRIQKAGVRECMVPPTLHARPVASVREDSIACLPAAQSRQQVA
jgi:hypothetical protein